MKKYLLATTALIGLALLGTSNIVPLNFRPTLVTIAHADTATLLELVTGLTSLNLAVTEAKNSKSNDPIALAALGEIAHVLSVYGKLLEQAGAYQGVLTNQINQIDTSLDVLRSVNGDLIESGITPISNLGQKLSDELASTAADLAKLEQISSIGGLIKTIGTVGGGALTAYSYYNEMKNYKTLIESGEAKLLDHMTITKNGLKAVVGTVSGPLIPIIDDLIIAQMVIPVSDALADDISRARTMLNSNVADILTTSNMRLRKRLMEHARGGEISVTMINAIIKEENQLTYSSLETLKEIANDLFVSNEDKANYEAILQRAFDENLRPSDNRLQAGYLIASRFANQAKAVISTFNNSNNTIDLISSGLENVRNIPVIAFLQPTLDKPTVALPVIVPIARPVVTGTSPVAATTSPIAVVTPPAVTVVPPAVIVPPPIALPVWAGSMSMVGRAADMSPHYRSYGLNVSGKAPSNNTVIFEPEFGQINSPIIGTNNGNGFGHAYAHLIWGDWSGGNRTFTRGLDGVAVNSLNGFFVYGEAMPVGTRTGIATYTGQVIGDLVRGTDQSIATGVVTGTLGVTANLGNSSLSGWLALIRNGATSPWVVADINNANISVNKGVTGFNGSLVGSNGENGNLSGNFFGATGSELGGSYWLNGTDDTSGIFLGYETPAMPVRPSNPVPQVVYNDWRGMSAVSRAYSGGTFYPGRGASTNAAGSQAIAGNGSAFSMLFGDTSVTARIAPNGDHFAAGRFSELNDSSAGRYENTAMGAWDGSVVISDHNTNVTHTLNRGLWVIGNVTPVAQMPRSGTANYSGHAIADLLLSDAINGNRVIERGVSGSMNMSANFGTGNVTGDMTLFRTDTNALWAVNRFETSGGGSVSINHSSSPQFAAANNFDGELVSRNSDVGSGVIAGYFYGPGKVSVAAVGAATEAGGYWTYGRGDGQRANGVFRAKAGAAPEAPIITPPVITPSVLPVPRHRGFVSGTLGERSLFYTDVRTADNGRTAIQNGTNSLFSPTITPEATLNVTSASYGSFGGIHGGSNYQYTAWGEWNGNGAVFAETSRNIERGHWVVGRVTSPDEFAQRTGSASYKGDLRGLTYNGGTVTGDINISANFNTDRLAGDFYLLAPTGPWVSGTIPDLAIDSRGTIVQFGGGMNISGGGSGNISGTFMGPSAQEISGAWAVRDIPTSSSELGGANGVFRAREQ